MTATTTKKEVQFGYRVMVGGKLRRNRFDDLEEAVQYIRNMKDGGKSARLFRELPNCSLAR